MTKKPVILPLAIALAALTVEKATAAAPDTKMGGDAEHQNAVAPANLSDANILVNTGKDFLAFNITQNADGTIVAQHRSHSSHSSHSSHRSHSSSRY
jgi:hypothetical protein